MVKTIPKSLIYEEIDGKPIYYRNYQKVLNQQLTLEEVMGSSIIQSRLVAFLVSFLDTQLFDKGYVVATNEAGIHLGKGNNLSGDILIHENSDDFFSAKYLHKPPKIVIEVDMKASPESIGTALDYFHIKTQKLLDFGVTKVIWISTQTQLVTVVSSPKNMQIFTWSENIEILSECTMNIWKILKKRGIQPLEK